MTPSARNQLQSLLSHVGDTTADTASVNLPADVLELHVETLGAIPLPIRSTSAAQLMSMAKPAHFGKGEETLHDPSVRDTWELSPNQVELHGKAWESQLADALQQLGSRLGLPSTAKLSTQLHSMLVYGQGQFFAPHQDSEKHDDMVATLVVSLPSAHTGGELLVDDRGALKQYTAPSDELGLVMFYADRRHEVLPVRSGHRVILTFNVLMQTQPITAPPEQVDQARALLQQHFETPAVSTFGRDLGVPQRLVFLLDHEYSQHGLHPDRLKGVDAQRVAILTAAADATGYEHALALSEIEETWDVQASIDFDDYDDHYDDYECEDFEETEGELNGFIDGSIVLTWWTDSKAPGAIRLPLDGDTEVCAVTPTAALQAYESHFEGYMGNYGNTVDRWYRRAAVILWPKSHAFFTRAEAAPQWALESIRLTVEDGDREYASSQVTALLATGIRPPVTALPTVLKIAAGLNQPETTMGLLKSFSFEALNVADAHDLAQIANLYRPSFWNEIFEHWNRNYHPSSESRSHWIEATLEPLCVGLRGANAANFADRIIEQMRNWLFDGVQFWNTRQDPTLRNDRLAELGPATATILLSANDRQASNLVGELQSLGASVLALLIATLRSNAAASTPPFDMIANSARDQLTELLAQPERSPNDWSITWTSTGGQDADRLQQFLNAPDERVLEWPLAKPRRQQIHMAIDQAGLPVTHSTRRKGSPHVLILRKTTELFTREALTRNQAARDLAWVAEHFE